MLVTTLPITPSKNNHFSIHFSPLIASLLAKFIGAKLVISTNAIGKRFDGMSEEEKSQLFTTYHERLSRMEVSSDRKWNEKADGYMKFVEKTILELHRKGIVITSVRQILSCDCGALETLQNAIPSFNGKVISVVGSHSLKCNLCGKYGTIKSADVLLMKLGSSEKVNCDVHPSWAKKEAHSLLEHFSNKEMLISRNRPTNPSIKVGETTYNLDVDIVWSLYAAYLCEQMDDNEIVLVTSNRTLRQAVQVARIANMMNANTKISILVNPTIDLRIVSPNSPLGEDLNADTFIDLAQPKTLRYFLATGLKWDTKSSYLPSDMLYLVDHSINPERVLYKDGPERVSRDINSFTATFNAETIKSTITKLRKKKELDAAERTVHELI